METRRWTNPSQPQTLQAAVFLLYINAAFNVFFGRVLVSTPVLGVSLPIYLIAAVTGVAGGLGIASERRWGYLVAGATGGLLLIPVLETLLTEGIAEIFSIGLILLAIYPVVLLVLLAHPQSRDYQRIWFS